MDEYIAWIGTLAPEDRAIVHSASSYFASVHARDLDSFYAAHEAQEHRIRALERRIAALEAEQGRAREAGGDGG